MYKNEKKNSKLDFLVSKNTINEKPFLEYQMYFDSPKQVVANIDQIEEENLVCIQLIEKNDLLLKEMRRSSFQFENSTNKKIEQLENNKKEFLAKVKKVEENIFQLQKKNESFNLNPSVNEFLEIVRTIFAIYNNFKSKFEQACFQELKNSADLKSNIILSLSNIEQFVYKVDLQLKEFDSRDFHRHVF